MHAVLLALLYLPAGQTQSVPSSKNSPLQDEQLVALPEQLEQFGSQLSQLFPFSKNPGLQLETHDPL
jgi:hypothetical protein